MRVEEGGTTSKSGMSVCVCEREREREDSM